MPMSGKEFQFNTDMGLAKMVEAVGAKLTSEQVGYFLVNLNDLTFEEVWNSKFSGVHLKNEDSVLVVVAQK